MTSVPQPNTQPLSPGIETDELDPAIRPQDDLFRHVNQKWIDRTEIPSDKARYGSFYVLGVPSSLRALLTGVTLSPSDPPIVLGKGGRDGESVALDALLELRLRWPDAPSDARGGGGRGLR